MKTVLAVAAVLAALFTTLVSARADDALVFEVHAVADRPGPHTREYLGLTTATDGKPESTLLVDPPLLDSKAIRFVSVSYDEEQKPFILINLSESGARKFEQITKEKMGQQIGFVIGGQLYSLPRIMETIHGGKIAINGNFTARQAANLAERLNAGLPGKAEGR